MTQRPIREKEDPPLSIMERTLHPRITTLLLGLRQPNLFSHPLQLFCLTNKQVGRHFLVGFSFHPLNARPPPMRMQRLIVRGYDPGQPIFKCMWYLLPTQRVQLRESNSNHLEEAPRKEIAHSVPQTAPPVPTMG